MNNPRNESPKDRDSDRQPGDVSRDRQPQQEQRKPAQPGATRERDEHGRFKPDVKPVTKKPSGS